MSGLAMFIAPVMAEVENPVAMFFLCLDYAVIFYGWTIPQFNYGPKNLYNCPVNPYIPEFLMASGILQCFMVISFILPCWLGGWSLDGTKRKVYIAWNSLLGVALLIIYIIGAVWTFSVFSQVQYDEPRLDTYCDRGTYVFSATCISITFGLVWITLIVLFVTTWWPKISRRSEYANVDSPTA